MGVFPRRRTVSIEECTWAVYCFRNLLGFVFQTSIISAPSFEMPPIAKWEHDCVTAIGEVTLIILWGF